MEIRKIELKDLLAEKQIVELKDGLIEMSQKDRESVMPYIRHYIAVAIRECFHESQKTSKILTSQNVVDCLDKRLAGKEDFDYSVYMDMSYCLDFALSSGDMAVVKKVCKRIDVFFFGYFRKDYEERFGQFLK